MVKTRLKIAKEGKSIFVVIFGQLAVLFAIFSWSTPIPVPTFQKLKHDGNQFINLDSQHVHPRGVDPNPAPINPPSPANPPPPANPASPANPSPSSANASPPASNTKKQIEYPGILEEVRRIGHRYPMDSNFTYKVDQPRDPDYDPLDPVPDDHDKLLVHGQYYDHIDRKRVKKLCPINNVIPCRSSNEYFLVCGNDKKIYRNLGVLECMQKCYNNLRLEHYGPCKDYQKPPRPHPKYVPTQAPKQLPFFDELMIVIRDKIKYKNKWHNHTESDEVYDDLCLRNPGACRQKPIAYSDKLLYMLPVDPYPWVHSNVMAPVEPEIKFL